MRAAVQFSGVLFFCCIGVACPGCKESQRHREKSQNLQEIDGKQKTAEAGRERAENDLAMGWLMVRTLPLPSPPWAGRFSQLVRDQGIKMKATQTVAEYHTDYIQAYNQRMMIEIEKKFGRGIIEKLETRARQELKNAP
jgi:hypothetical protein